MYKSILNICSFLMSVVLISGCNQPKSEESIIRDVTYNYLNAMSRYDFDDAANYATPQTNDVTINFCRKAVTFMSDSALKAHVIDEISIIDVDKKSDTSAVVVYHRSTAEQNQNDSIGVVLRDGRWSVDYVIEINPLILMLMEKGPHKVPKDEMPE